LTVFVAAKMRETASTGTKVSCMVMGAFSGRADDAHLKAHPKQQVVQIRLLHLPSRWPRPAPGVTFVALEMNLRARTQGSNVFDYSLGGFCQPSHDRLRCKPEWRAGSWRIEPGADGSLFVRNDDITINPSSSAAEERSQDAVTLKAANDEAAWQMQRMGGPCNYDARTSSSADPPVR
jgi:hypothetical protein